MRRRNRPLVVLLLCAAGCSAGSGDNSPSGESADAALGQSVADGSTDARSTTPSSEAAVGDSRGPLTDGSHDVDSGDVADARKVSDASSVSLSDASDASAADAGAAEGGDSESGRLVGITAAHNAVRAMVSTQPPLPPLVWSQTIADYAQQWATSLATSMCAQPQHRSTAELEAKDYGENLATFGAGGLLQSGEASTAVQAVDAWAAEKACWTYGTIQGTEVCNTACYTNLHSDGCGHYTQVVWRSSTQLGCGVASCKNGGLTEDIWICNYAPAGNVIGRAPY